MMKHKVFIFFNLIVFLSTPIFANISKVRSSGNNGNGTIIDGCVTVAENPTATDGTKISICYKWLQPYDQSKKTFLFLVGGPGASFEYYMLFGEFWLNTNLGKNYNLLFFDPRGVGHSSEINSANVDSHDLRQYTLANMTDDIESLRKNLLGDQSIGLIGHSTGGHQVFDYAIRFPEHVSKIISLHGGASGLGFQTQVYYRLNEWQKAGASIEPQKLVSLQQLVQSGSACDSDGSKLLPTSWNQLTSYALYGTVSQRKMLPKLIMSLVQGNIDSQSFCQNKSVNVQKEFPILQSNDPLNAMSGINPIINANIVCSNFITKASIGSLPAPFHDPTFNFIWSPQCQPLLMSGKITEDQFDVRTSISQIQVPILVVGSDGDQWIPFKVQNEIWENMTDPQKIKSEIHELRQCGHFSFYECPHQLKLIIDHFLN